MFLPHCLSNWFLSEPAITRERQHRRAVSRKDSGCNPCWCTGSRCRWTRSECKGTHRRRERKCPERQRDGTAGEPAAVSLLTINTAFEHIEDMQYACDASKLNTRHRRAPPKRLQVVHRLDKVIVINGLGADYAPPSLPVDLISNRTGDYTWTTTSPHCVEIRLGSQRLWMYR